jgi:hypothetical protein
MRPQSIANMGGVAHGVPPLHTSPLSLRALCDELQHREAHRPPNHDIPAITEDALRREWLSTEIRLKVAGVSR